MPVGDMTERVSFVRSGRTKRADGGYDVADSTLATVWASVRPVSAREGEEAGRLVGAVSYLVEVWRDDLPSGLTTDDRVTWVAPAGGSDVQFNLRGIEMPRGRDLLVKLICEKGTQL